MIALARRSWGLLLGAALAGAPLAAGAAGRPSAADSLPAPDSLAWVLRRGGGFGERGSAPRQMLEPRGLAVDAFGRYVIADAGMHRIVRFDREGEWIGEAGGLGGDAGQLRRPVAVSLLGATGFAVLDQENFRVVSYDLFGNRAGVVVSLDSKELASTLGRVRAEVMAADGGGALYLADAESDRLLVFDFSGRFLRTLGAYGSQPGQLRRLAGIAVGPRGELWLAERGNARLQHWDAAGQVVGAWPLPVRRGAGSLALAVDDSARVAVADEEAGRVLWLDAAGRLVGVATGFARPAAICFVAPGRLAVLEAGRARVTWLDLSPRP